MDIIEMVVTLLIIVSLIELVTEHKKITAPQVPNVDGYLNLYIRTNRL